MAGSALQFTALKYYTPPQADDIYKRRLLAAARITVWVYVIKAQPFFLRIAKLSALVLSLSLSWPLLHRDKVYYVRYFYR